MQYNLGLMYYHGTGVPQDHLQAARLVKLASDQDCQYSQTARDTLDKFTALFPTGTRVEITGLTAAAHLNGRLPPATMAPAAGPIAVRIDSQPKSLSLSWANLSC